MGAAPASLGIGRTGPCCCARDSVLQRLGGMQSAGRNHRPGWGGWGWGGGAEKKLQREVSEHHQEEHILFASYLTVWPSLITLRGRWMQS